MTTNLIIAPPAAGKTAACINQILAIHKEHPLDQVWVVVPNPQKAAYFKSRLAEAGGGMGVRVGAFRNFYQEILEENGSFVPVITPALLAPPDPGNCAQSLCRRRTDALRGNQR